MGGAASSSASSPSTVIEGTGRFGAGTACASRAAGAAKAKRSDAVRMRRVICCSKKACDRNRSGALGSFDSRSSLRQRSISECKARRAMWAECAPCRRRLRCFNAASPVLLPRAQTHPAAPGRGAIGSGPLAGRPRRAGAGAVVARRAPPPQPAHAGGDPAAQEERAATAVLRGALADAVDRLVAGQPLLRHPPRLLDARAPRRRAHSRLAGGGALRAGAVRLLLRRPRAPAREGDGAGGRTS